MSRSGQNGPQAKSHMCKANRRTRLYCVSYCCFSPFITRVWRGSEKINGRPYDLFSMKGVGHLAQCRIDLPRDRKMLRVFYFSLDVHMWQHAQAQVVTHTSVRSLAVAVLGCRLVFHSAGSVHAKTHFFLSYVSYVYTCTHPSVFIRKYTVHFSFNFGPHPLVCLYSCMYEWEARTWKTVWRWGGEVVGLGTEGRWEHLWHFRFTGFT